MTRILLVCALLLSACAGLPPIQPADENRQSLIDMSCRSHFLKGRWQLVHTINARLYGGRQATFTGVIVLSSAVPSIHCVLMTLEGFVLFEAVDNGEVVVKRAFGPFENIEFAKGVMGDIRFIFIAPEGKVQTVGIFKDGHEGCRYCTDDNRVVDVVGAADGSWRIRQHDPLKTLIADAVDRQGVSPKLTLVAGGRHAYQLSMTLVEAFPID